MTASVACADPTNGGTETTQSPGEASCVLGTGSLTFEPLADGDNLPIIFGPQGGYHVWGSHRAAGVEPGDYYDAADPQNPTTVFNAYLGDGSRVGGTAPIRMGLKVRSDGTMEHIGEPVILAITDPAEIAGQSGRVAVEVEDVRGVAVMDEVAIVFVPEQQ